MFTAVAAGFCLGVLSQLAWPVLPDAHWLLGSGVVASLAAWRGLWPTRRIAAGVLAVAAGMGWAAWSAWTVLDARLPVTLEGEDVWLEGTVSDLRVHADGATAFVLRSDALPWHPGGGVRPPGDWRIRVASWQPAAMQAGERWRLCVRLRRPHASVNPGGADFEQYLLGERVVATGNLREGAFHVRQSAASGWMAWRSRLLGHLWPLFGDGPGDIAQDDAARFARAVLPALLVDERSLLSAPQWRVLASTGTAHLVAISGLHVALLWGAVLWVGARLLGRRTGSLRYRALAVFPALGAAVAYAALAGMPLPALRATLMLAAASVLLVVFGAVPAWRVLLAATAFVLLVDPLAAHAVGFWLSHGAVALLLLINDLSRRPPRAQRGARWTQAVAGSVRLQVLLSVLMAPALFWLFGAASTSSVVANLPAIPLVNFLALPPGLAGLLLAPAWPAAADICVDGATLALAWLWRLLVWVDGITLLAPLPAPGTGGVAAFSLLSALLLLIFARRPVLRFAGVPLLVLAWPVAPALPPGVAEVCVLDVGEGLAATVRTARHAALYDAGPVRGADSDAGITVVVPSARALGMSRLDLLVLSHDDAAHAGGARSVVAALRPRETVLGEPALRRYGAGQGGTCRAPRHWRVDGVDFLLVPGAEGGGNDASCVLRVAAGASAVLLAGDVTRRREDALVAEYGAALRADVLVAPNHGSRASLGPALLETVAPSAVVFPVGYRNRHGHPHPQVVAAVRQRGAAVHDTGRDGAVCARLVPGAGPEVRRGRAERRRFWRD